MSQRNLVKWQFVSMLSKFTAIGAGLVQSIIIARILSVAELGLRDIAKGVGKTLGIIQHFGLASASIREISIAQDKSETFRIFVTSLVTRYCLTTPIGVGLFLMAPYLANTFYNIPALLTPIRVFALVILVEGSQGILTSIVTGMKRFKFLFSYQAAISLVSLVIYLPLVYYYRVNGFFYAMFIHNVIWTISLGIFALWPLRGYFAWPSKQEFVRVFKTVFKISFGIYIAKIFFTLWENFGSNYLGKIASLEMVGYFTFAAFFAHKIIDVSDAVTDVNLPVMSEKYDEGLEEFKVVFRANFNKIFAFIILSAAAATYWAPEVIDLLLEKGKYAGSFVLITPLIVAFVSYAFINIIKSSVLIPAKLTRAMVVSFVMMFLSSVGLFFGIKDFVYLPSAMAYALAFGALVGLALAVTWSQKQLMFGYFSYKHFLVALQALVICYLSLYGVWWFKAMVFGPLYGLLVAGVFIAGFITKDEITRIVGMLKSRLRAGSHLS